MADGYDRFENEGGGGGSFVMGLLTGTVLGAGLGMLFAPRAGSELRNQISEQAGNLANKTSEGYRKATETASDWADRGREVYDKAKDAVSRGADEAQKYSRDVANSVSGGAPSTPASGGTGSTGPNPTFGGSSSHSSPESVRGAGPSGPTHGGSNPSGGSHSGGSTGSGGTRRT
jgi:gas vesicle protein